MANENIHTCDKCDANENAWKVKIQCLCDSCLEERDQAEYDRGYAAGVKEAE